MPEFSNPRQSTAYEFVKSHPGCTAREVAEAIEPGSDPRGAGQTLRALANAGYVTRRDDATYVVN
jgi:hypothetical protein